MRRSTRLAETASNGLPRFSGVIESMTPSSLRGREEINLGNPVTRGKPRV
jgi:hypothetical protein